MNWIEIVKEKDIKERVEKKIVEIFNVLNNSNNYTPLGLLNGYSGMVLFLFFYYKHTKSEILLKLLHEKIEYIYNQFLNKTSASFCNGYSGVCWLIRFLHKNQIIQCTDINDMLSDIDYLIYQHFLVSYNNIDFLHGGLGIAYYFVFTDSEKGRQAIDIFLNELEKNKISNSDGSAKWLSEVYVKYESKGLVYNLSLSHGMAAIVAFLVKLVKSTPRNTKALKILKETVLFYKKNANPSHYKSTFSKWLDPNDNIYIESPLSWCYGDPGIANALYNAGLLLGDQELITLSLSALIKTTCRLTDKEENINEAFFCHGSSSLCHIYNRLYQETSLQCFKDSSFYWLKKTLDKGNNLESALAGYNLIEVNKSSNNTSILTGLSGIALSLLATVSTELPQWDECLLLS